MILIISSSEDLSTDLVIDWLRYYNKEFIRINFTELINPEKKVRMSYSIDKNVLRVGEKEIDLKQVKAIWFRKLGAFKKSPYYFNGLSQEIATEILNQILAEYNAFFSAVLQNVAADCYWVTHQKTRGINKWNVLKRAHDAGLAVPLTSIVNNLDDLKTLRVDHAIITKSIKEPFFINETDSIYSMYTKEVGEQVIDMIPHFFAPSLVQKKIEKEFEIRIFFIDDEYFPMAIFSQKDNQTAVDFRDYNFENFNRCVPYKMPHDVIEKLKTLMNDLGLNCGSIDMIKDKGGNFVFLEVNPNGQFGMVEFPCNYNLHKLVAEKLISA